MARPFMPYDQDIVERRRVVGAARRAREAAARAKGTHTKAEWTALTDVFGRCVRCDVPYSDLHGGMPSKDHIRQLYRGGCDCIANIQPLCRNCNSAKTGDSTDYRPLARQDWVRAYLGRLEHGWAA
jgi:5-methylcytosine-specific restriction endonuclease McrA